MSTADNSVNHFSNTSFRRLTVNDPPGECVPLVLSPCSKLWPWSQHNSQYWCYTSVVSCGSETFSGFGLTDWRFSSQSLALLNVLSSTEVSRTQMPHLIFSLKVTLSTCVVVNSVAECWLWHFFQQQDPRPSCLNGCHGRGCPGDGVIIHEVKSPSSTPRRVQPSCRLRRGQAEL